MGFVWMKRGMIGLVSFVILGLAIYLAKNQILERVLQSKLSEVSQKIGMPISFDHAQLIHLNAVRLHHLQVGFEPVLDVKMVEVHLQRDGLFDFKPRPTLVYFHTPRIELGGADQKEAVERLQQRLKRLKKGFKGLSKRRPNLRIITGPLIQNEQANRSNSEFDVQALMTRVQGILTQLPQIEVAYGQVHGGRGSIQIEDLRLQLNKEQLIGTWRAQQPSMGKCGVNASLEGAKVSCERDVSIPVNEDITVVGRALSWTPQPTPMIHLNGFTATLGGTLGAHLPFSELRADLTLGLEKNDRGARPIQVILRFPGGGAVQAEGSLSRERGELLTQLERFPAHAVSQRARGLISADVKLVIQPLQGHLQMEGKLSGENLILEHEALAEGVIGPFEISTQGRINLDWDPKDRRQLRLRISESELKLGQIRSDFRLEWDQFLRPPKLNASFDMDYMKAQSFADSIPANLLPHLQPLTLEGNLAFKGGIDLDMADLEATKLTFTPNLRRLKVIGHNEMINFEALKTAFVTEFVMPEGEIYTREVGPKNERWVPLNELPPLLTQAIVAQEDGGFYKHSGISLFHLRGSLVRNLTEGRFARGGSTLTMQLTRNLFLNKHKNLSRKLEELCLTWYLEKKLTKNEIIELYVNVVEFGPNLFGIREAAAQYFNKHPKALRPEEIVALTRLLPGPRLYARFFERKRLSKAYTNRLNRLLALLVKRGHLEAGSFRQITPTNLWDPYEDDLKHDPNELEGGAMLDGGAIGTPEPNDTPSVDPSTWGKPTYQAP